MGRGLIVTQASQQVGYGHLMECLAIAQERTTDDDIKIFLIQSDSEAASLIQENGFSVISELHLEAHKVKYSWIFLNTRENDPSLQKALYSKTSRLIILDELGNRPVSCHALINFSVNPAWHTYPMSEKQPVFYFGPAYYPLRTTLKAAKQSALLHKSILVSLGGTDRSATVLRVARILAKFEDLSVSYILGPGCKVSDQQLAAILPRDSKQKIVRAPQNFDSLLATHEFVISAGGNTLYEAAYLDKKILVVWEDAHEKIQGRHFEEAGLATVVGSPDAIDVEVLLGVIYGKQRQRKKKELVDGLGIQRIWEIILKNEG